MATMTLSDFILARIAEDEEAARAATEGPWRVGDAAILADGSVPTIVVDLPPLGVYNHRQRTSDAAHIARHDPAHVLAVCAAHRRIVEMHASDGGHECPPVVVEQMSGLAGYFSADECPTLRALASAYADHEDWREEWAL